MTLLIQLYLRDERKLEEDQCAGVIDPTEIKDDGRVIDGLSLRAIALHGIYKSNFCITNFKY
jgi:hypothetical protein